MCRGVLTAQDTSLELRRMVEEKGGVAAVQKDEDKMKEVVEHLTIGHQLTLAEMSELRELVRGQPFS